MVAHEPRTTRLLVIEHHTLIAKALCHFLAVDPSIDIVGDARSIKAEELRKWRPDLIVLGVDHSTRDIADALALAKETLPEVRICILSSWASPELMQSSLQAGADGFIVKDITRPELENALRAVAAGGSYVDARVAGGVLKRRGGGRGDLNELSLREREIIKLIAAGLSNKEISARLVLSEKTIKNHISRIFTKLNVTARTQAAVHAIRTGMV
ncbi:MAG: response regulator transcription factor [Candidatus Velthaea sp.]